MDYSPRSFTRDKLKKMGHSSAIGSPAGNSDGTKDSEEDDYGQTAGKSSAQLRKSGGKVHGKGKAPHMGRAGRATGGRVGRDTGGKVGTTNTQMKDDESPIRMGEMPKYNRNSGGRVGRARGGKTGKGKTVVNVIVGGGKDQQQQPAPPPMAPPMAPPQQPPPKPPMPPPQQGGPPIMMPPGGGPMGPAGAPPPGGGPPMHARGGRVKQGFSDGPPTRLGNLGKYAHPAKAGFSDSKAPHVGGGKEGFSDTKPTTKRAPEASGSKDFRVKRDPNETAGNNGEGRLEKARRQA
jgi:hypothetical protein